MKDLFIDKLKKIILEHLEDEQFGVRELAVEIGLSRSQLLRKVKESTGISPSELINNVRLEEAAKKIKESDCTAAEISYQVGFSSPSYFNKCFQRVFGCTPGEYKNQIGESYLDFKTYSKSKMKNRNSLIKITLFSILGILILIISFNLFINKNYTKNEINYFHPSVVILPFLNLSENESHDYITNGITESITAELSKFDSIRVISRTSAMTYKEGNKSSSEIAKELNVDYLVEGSVLYTIDSLRITVQLIKALPNEKHIFTKTYKLKFVDILQLVEVISNDIAFNINIAIKPKTNNINKHKINTTAYDLYLRGRYLWTEQSDYTIKQSINLLTKSIEIDSSFAPAHVTLAEAYISLNKFISNYEEIKINREKSKIAVNKALVLDNALAEAYITKGNILGKFEWNWEEMKSMLEKGLKLDPNNAYGHLLLSNYFLINGNNMMAISEALIAEKLDPLNPMIGTMVGNIYCSTNNCEKAIEQYKKVLELYPNYGSALSDLGLALYNNNQKEESKNTFIVLQENRGNYEMVKAYKENLMEDVFKFWLLGAKKKNPKYCSYPILIAQVHMLLNEKEETLKYLEIAYKYRNEYLPIMLYRQDFKPLHNEPRFKAIVKNVGVRLN